MSIPLIINGQTYTFPTVGEIGWGNDVTTWAQAVTSSMLQKSAGLFALTNELDFGAAFGVKSLYFKSRSSNVASSGVLRLSEGDGISFRNSANTGDNILTTNSNDELTYNGQPLQFGMLYGTTSTIALSTTLGTVNAEIVPLSITNALISPSFSLGYSNLNLGSSIVNSDISGTAAISYGKLNLGSSIVNSDISGTAAISYGKLNLGSSIVNSDISGTANIDLSKLASLGTNLIVVTDGTGKLSASAVPSANLNYLDATSSIQTQLNSKLNLSGGTMSGSLVLNGDPTVVFGAATKQYVDNSIQGLKTKNSCRVATVVSGTLASSFTNGQTIDGITIATGDRILIKNQTNQTENGIYVVNASGAPTRSTDADTWLKLVSAFVFIEQGSSNADTGWVCTIDAGGTLGVNNVTFTQFSSAGSVTADGLGINLTGGVLSLTLDGASLSKSVSGLRVAVGGITNTEVSNTAAITYSKLNLGSSIRDSDVLGTANIALSKLASTTASRVLISGTDGKITASTVTPTTLGYLDATSSIQTQLNGKVSAVSPTFTGTLTVLAGSAVFNATPVTVNGASLNVLGGNVNVTGSLNLSNAGTNTVTIRANSGTFSDFTLTMPTSVGASGQFMTTDGSGGLSWSGAPGAPIVITPGAYPYNASNNEIILVNTVAARSVNLPAPAANTRITIKDAAGSASVNNITLVRSGTSQLIDGVAANKIYQTNWGAITLVSNGTNWFIC